MTPAEPPLPDDAPEQAEIVVRCSAGVRPFELVRFHEMCINPQVILKLLNFLA